jgi:RNA polymerase sigma factor (sigma-70 family)
VINEALGRLYRRRPTVELTALYQVPEGVTREGVSAQGGSDPSAFAIGHIGSDQRDLVLEAAQEPGAGHIVPFPLTADDDPERSAARREIRHLLEQAIDELPDVFRLVFMMRSVEEMSVEETASQLGVPEATAKTRLHRARLLLCKCLDAKLASALTDAFPFLGARCARIGGAVLARLRLPGADQTRTD